MKKIMMNFKLAVVPFLVLICSACTSNSTSSHGFNKGDGENVEDTVSLDQGDGYGQDTTSKDLVNKSYSPQVGPIISSDSSQKSDDHESFTAVFIGDGLYKSFLSSHYLNGLKQKQNIQVFSGSGLGLILASFLAHQKTSEEIDWFLFKLSEELEDLVINSSEWRELIVSHAQDFLKIDKIEKLNSFLIVPLFNQKTKKIEFIKRGSYKDLMLASLRWYFEGKGNKEFTHFLSSSIKPYYQTQELLKMRGVHVLCIDSLGASVDESVQKKSLNLFLSDQESLSKNFLRGFYLRQYSLKDQQHERCHEVLGVSQRYKVDDLTLLKKAISQKELMVVKSREIKQRE